MGSGLGKSIPPESDWMPCGGQASKKQHDSMILIVWKMLPFFDQLKVEVCISCLREFDGELFESGLKPRKRVHFRTAAEFFHETQRSILVSEVSL